MIRRRESLVLYKSFNTLWVFLFYPPSFCSSLDDAKCLDGWDRGVKIDYWNWVGTKYGIYNKYLPSPLLLIEQYPRRTRILITFRGHCWVLLAEKELRGLSPNFHIHVSVSNLQYLFPRSVHLFSCCRIGRPIMGIWERRNWPRSSFSGNICFEFGIVSLQCPTQPGADNSNIQIIGNAVFVVLKNIECSTTGKPTRSFATERVSLDSV